MIIGPYEGAPQYPKSEERIDPVEDADLRFRMYEYVIEKLGDDSDPLGETIIDHLRSEAEHAYENVPPMLRHLASEGARVMFENSIHLREVKSEEEE